MHAVQQSFPVLVYDGDCGFCRYWVAYWVRLTGPRVIYRPYQEAAADYPDIAPEEFSRAIYLFMPNGQVTHGADAAFRVLATVAGHGGFAWCYRRVPGFAWLAEFAYGFISRHRVTAARVSRVLWGPLRLPAEHSAVAGLFLRLLGFIYLAAFWSFGVQALGLIGADGVLPLHLMLARAEEALGTSAYFALPTLFWLSHTDIAIQIACWLGVVSAGGLVLGIAKRACLILCYVLYLSLFYGGQEFMGFQWDLLLLEVGFLAIFLVHGSTLVVWLFRWLTFRFLLLAGLPKLQSGDPTWWNLTALQYHFETQPLPTPLAWFARELPATVLRVGTGYALLLELVLVFLVFSPRRPRMLLAAATVLFQLLIIATGNYNFFNLLTIALCVLLLDDAALQRILPKRWLSHVRCATLPYARWRQRSATALAAVYLTLGIVQIYEQVYRAPVYGPLHSLYAHIAPLRLVNGYGLFANMTTSRPEIVIEGSNDGREWFEYGFRYKPGELQKPPAWNIPHQPRLDWQMWFAALGSAEQNPWFGNFLLRLLQASPAVLKLLETNPFPDAPPKFVRALLYDYRFTSRTERAASGAWYRRELTGLYYPAVSL